MGRQGLPFDKAVPASCLQAGAGRWQQERDIFFENVYQSWPLGQAPVAKKVDGSKKPNTQRLNLVGVLLKRGRTLEQDFLDLPSFYT